MEQYPIVSGVYFIVTADEQFVKIGYSARIFQRFAAIRGSSPSTAGARLVGYLAGTRETERKLHAQFAEHKWSGEWFRYVGELLAFSLTILKLSEIQIDPPKEIRLEDTLGFRHLPKQLLHADATLDDLRNLVKRIAMQKSAKLIEAERAVELMEKYVKRGNEDLTWGDALKLEAKAAKARA